MLLDFLNMICFYVKCLRIKFLSFLLLAVVALCLFQEKTSKTYFLAPAHRGFVSVSNLKSIKKEVKSAKRKIVSYSKINDIIERHGKIALVIKYIPEGAITYFIDGGGNLAGMDHLYIPYTFDLSSKTEFMHSLSFVYQKIESIYNIKPIHLGALYILADTTIPYQLDTDFTEQGVLDDSKEQVAYYKEIEKTITKGKDDQGSFEITLYNTSDLRCIGEAALNFGDIFTGLESVSKISDIKSDFENLYFGGDFGERDIYSPEDLDSQAINNSQDLASVLAVPSIINDILTSFSQKNGNDALLNWLGLDNNYSQIRYLLQKRSYYNEETSYFTISDTEKYSAIYLKLKHKIASGDEWVIEYMNKLLTDVGSLCANMLAKYPKGYYIALKIDENLNFGVIPRRNPTQESKIIISGDFLGEFLALNDIEGEEFIKVIRASAGLSPDSKSIINSSYSTSVESYALSVIFADYRQKTEQKQVNSVKYNTSRDFKALDLVDNKYSFLNYIAHASEFFAQKYGIILGNDATVYMRIGRNSVIGTNIKIAPDCNFIISSDDYKRSKIYIGSNLQINSDIDVTVRGAGKVIFADNAILKNSINILVPETSVAYIDSEGIALYPKNPEDVLTESFNLLLENTLTKDGSRFEAVINTIYNKVRGNDVRFTQQDLDFLYNNLSIMLSQREADFLIAMFEAGSDKVLGSEMVNTVDGFGFEIYPFFDVNNYIADLKQNPVSNMLYQYKTIGKGEASEHIIEKYMVLDEFKILVDKVNELISDLKERNKVKYFTLADYKLSTIFDRAT